MTHSINNVQVQIPGTAYYLQLTADRGRWILALLLRGKIESEVVVPIFAKNSLVKAANELLNNTRIQMDKYPLKNVCDQLFAEAEANLPTVQNSSNEVDRASDFNEMKQKLDLLENTINNINEELKESIQTITERLTALENERVSRLETELTKDELKGKEELISNIAGRLDVLEETIIERKGDDRVPSLITAIEALESKLNHLEGKTITTGEGELARNDMNGVHVELGKFSHAFDLINERLTILESRIEKTD